MSMWPAGNNMFIFNNRNTRTRCEIYSNRSSDQRCSVGIGVPRNFTKFTGKHLCQSLFFNKAAGLRPEACNFIKKETLTGVFLCFANFLRTPFSQNTSWRLLLFKVNNKDTRTTPICQWRRSFVFIINFEHISHLVLVFLLLTFDMYMPAGII